MKYILASLSALVSVASAMEVLGTYYIPASPAPASVAEASQATSQATDSASDVSQATDSTSDVTSSGEITLSAATVTQSTEPTQTPELATSSWAATEEMPYWHLTQNGYQQMDCGYGYYKDMQGYCQPESWVRAVCVLHFALVVDLCRSNCSIAKGNAMRPLSSISG